MLNILRKNTKTIVWTVILSFVIWGGYSVGTQFQKHGRVAGEIFGKEISFQEFDSFYRSSQIFSFTGKKLEDPNMIRLHAWQSMIFSREAKHKKIDVTDDEVRAEILRILKEDKIENPTADLYKKWVVAAVRETPQEFEKQIREILRIQKLIKQVNEPPVAAPSVEEAKRRFFLEHNMLSLEMIRFATSDEAKKFLEKAKTSPDWKKLAEEAGKKLEPTGKISLDAIINLWGFPEDSAKLLLDIEKNGTFGPVLVGGQYGITKVLEKEKADDQKFEKELKDKYIETLTSQKKYERFLSWNAEVQERAKLKDYVPAVTPPAPPDSPKPSTVENSAPAPKTTPT